jgi:hypothetical protein
MASLAKIKAAGVSQEDAFIILRGGRLKLRPRLKPVLNLHAYGLGLAILVEGADQPDRRAAGAKQNLEFLGLAGVFAGFVPAGANENGERIFKDRLPCAIIVGIVIHPRDQFPDAVILSLALLSGVFELVVAHGGFLSFLIDCEVQLLLHLCHVANSGLASGATKSMASGAGAASGASEPRSLSISFEAREGSALSNRGGSRVEGACAGRRD